MNPTGLLREWLIALPAGEAIWADDLETALLAALAGGKAACVYYESDELDVRDKAGGSSAAAHEIAANPVTRADHASNDAILQIIRSQSEDPILSEEAPAPPDRSASDRLWVVDPLDGTKEFIARNGEFCVMVGLAEDGRARLGAVYQPAAEKLYFGLVGSGAWMVDVARPTHTEPLSIDGARGRPLRLIRSRSHPDEALSRLERRLTPVDIVVAGSVGIKCARVASGAADLYVHPVPHLKEWDTCAPEAVLRGAGGLATDCAGGPLGYGKPEPLQPGGIFCASADVHEEVSPVVSEIAGHLFEA